MGRCNGEHRWIDLRRRIPSHPSHARETPIFTCFLDLSLRAGLPAAARARVWLVHLTPVRPRKGRKRKEGKKNWEPPRTNMGTGRHQSCVVHSHEILQSLSRNCIHHLSDVPRTHAHMQVCTALIQYMLFTCLLKVRLGWGFAQSRPQLVHVRHYLHLNGFLLPHLILPNSSSLSYLPLPSIPLSLSASLLW